jgi:hypothetical protein
MQQQESDDRRSGQGQQQQERGLEQAGHQGLPQSAEQQPAADASQLKPPEAPFPPEDNGAPTRDNRHPDARTAMSGEAPGG